MNDLHNHNIVFQKDEFLHDLEALVNIDSGSHDIEGLNSVADFLCKKYESIGLKPIRKTQGASNRPFVELYTHPDASEIDLLFLGHMDTVFEKGTVSQRPFRISEDGHWAYGPGVADMKAGDLLTFHLLRVLRKLCPQLKICVCHNSDEEIGSGDSAQAMQAIASKCRYSFVMEPGRPGGHFVYQRKGAVDIRVSCHGIAAHAGNAPQEGASAILEMTHIIQKMQALTNYETGFTVSAGLISGGSAANVIPDSCEAVFDVRCTDTAQLTELEEALRALCQNPFVPRTTVSWEKLSQMPPMKATEKTKILVELLQSEAARLSLQPEFLSVGGASDGSLLAAAGCAVIDGCGPEGDKLHSADEILRIDSIEERFRLLLSAIQKLPDIQT